MRKEISVILDTEQARNGLFLNGNYAALHKYSDEEIAAKAIEHVGKFASQLGFELAPKTPALNADVEKVMTVKVNTKIARQMLRMAGYWDVDEKSDEEVFALALSMNNCYGVEYENPPSCHHDKNEHLKLIEQTMEEFAAVRIALDHQGSEA